MNDPRSSMTSHRATMLRIVAHFAVAIFAGIANPKPAMFCFVDVLPEAILNGLRSAYLTTSITTEFSSSLSVWNEGAPAI